MEDDDKRKQELRPFLKVNDSFKKLVLTGDDVPMHRTEKGFVIMNVIDFMKDQDSLKKL
jgi:hypothetical protein